jgi:hypothetical protein
VSAGPTASGAGPEARARAWWFIIAIGAMSGVIGFQGTLLRLWRELRQCDPVQLQLPLKGYREESRMRRKNL